MSVNIINVKSQKIGKMPVVVLPLKVWRNIADRLEELEMINSKSLRKKIAIARKEKKLYTLYEAKRMAGV